MAVPADQRIAVPIDDPNADTEWYEYSLFQEQTTASSLLPTRLIPPLTPPPSR
jgi:hypothetical protein